MEYLIRRRDSGRAHYWVDNDTVCRMASTGGLNPKRYQVTNSNLGRPICHLCRKVAQSRKMTVPDDREISWELTQREGLIVKLENAKLGSRRDKRFANSLLAEFRRSGGLTDKQWYWVGELVGKSQRR